MHSALHSIGNVLHISPVRHISLPCLLSFMTVRRLSPININTFSQESSLLSLAGSVVDRYRKGQIDPLDYTGRAQAIWASLPIHIKPSASRQRDDMNRSSPVCSILPAIGYRFPPPGSQRHHAWLSNDLHCLAPPCFFFFP